MLVRHGNAVAALVLCTVTPAWAGTGDAWADTVVSYDAGLDNDPFFADASVTLGPPERFTGETFGLPSVVSPFSPAFGPDEILSIGRGGSLVVEFDPPVTDDPANPFGVDLIVFGNTGFIDGAFPAGIVSGTFGADGGALDVSADGVTWFTVPGLAPDDLFPTLGYLDAGPFDTAPGRVPSDFTRPVDPALTLAAVDGLDHAAVVALYDGAGGGTGVDLATVGLASVRFVRVRNPVGALEAIEIDGFSDVAPDATGAPGDLDADGNVGFADLSVLLAAWGACPTAPAPCPADLDGDGSVGFTDLNLLLAGWGP